MIFADDAIEELQTIGDLVRWGASCFQEAGLTYGHGTDNALDESYNLVRHVLHLPHDIPQYMIQCKVTKAERKKIVQLLLDRITTRNPAPYLINEAWFAGLGFYVDDRVLIPRSPISELIETQFEPWIDPDRVRRVLDLCTGSGCIAVACAFAFHDAMIDATDVSAAALEVAKINVEKYTLQEKVRLIQSDLFEGLNPAQDQYDIIVSNPPYVNAQDMASLTEEFQREPALALQAGQDGLDIVKRILRQAYDFLAPQGLLVVEVGNSCPELVEQYPELPFVWPEFVRGGHGVFVLTKEQLSGDR